MMRKLSKKYVKLGELVGGEYDSTIFPSLFSIDGDVYDLKTLGVVNDIDVATLFGKYASIYSVLLASKIYTLAGLCNVKCWDLQNLDNCSEEDLKNFVKAVNQYIEEATENQKKSNLLICKRLQLKDFDAKGFTAWGLNKNGTYYDDEGFNSEGKDIRGNAKKKPPLPVQPKSECFSLPYGTIVNVGNEGQGRIVQFSEKSLNITIKMEKGGEKKYKYTDGFDTGHLELMDKKYLENIKHDAESIRKRKPVPNPIPKPISTPTLTEVVSAKDFFVRSSIRKCGKKDHEIQNIIAIVPCVSREGSIRSERIPAGYCVKCKRYFILDSDYRQLVKKFVILCRVEDSGHEPLTPTEGPYGGLNQESVLHECGYNVSKNAKLTNSQREAVLRFVMDNEILTKVEICNHLDWLIGKNKYKAQLKTAVSKWEDDRKFVAEYRIDKTKRIQVRKIIKN